jgi:hypothetical protein
MVSTSIGTALAAYVEEVSTNILLDLESSAYMAQSALEKTGSRGRSWNASSSLKCSFA